MTKDAKRISEQELDKIAGGCIIREDEVRLKNPDIAGDLKRPTNKKNVPDIDVRHQPLGEMPMFVE